MFPAQDADDDVRAVAATALLPLAPALTAGAQAAAVATLHGHLWHILRDSDELSPATGVFTTFVLDPARLSCDLPNRICDIELLSGVCTVAFKDCVIACSSG